MSAKVVIPKSFNGFSVTNIDGGELPIQKSENEDMMFVNLDPLSIANQFFLAHCCWVVIQTTWLVYP